MPLGERLFNPFNLEKCVNINWLGQVDPGSDKVFCEFTSIEFGLRAGYLNLKNAIKNGHNTIEKLVNHYAPASDNNDVPAYIKALSKDTLLTPSEVIPVQSIKILGKAIITHEQGRCAYSDDQLTKAAIAAGVTNESPIVKPTLMQRVRSYFLPRKA